MAAPWYAGQPEGPLPGQKWQPDFGDAIQTTVTFKQWDGSNWITRTAVPKVWNGVGWMIRRPKYWNGSIWVDLT